MKITFTKYQGTGNDFVIVNAYVLDELNLDIHQIRQICERKYGVGSDGLIIIKKSEKTHFKMDFYNPDGSQSFCGNGSRCAVHFAFASSIIDENSCSFEAIDGIHKAYVCQDEVKIEMSHVGVIEKINTSIMKDSRGESYIVDTGSPHFVSYVKNKEELNSIIDYGKKIRYSDVFNDKGVNVNLIHSEDSNRIQIRTYERGVEDETFSCGTGATACALIHSSRFNSNQNIIDIETRGGALKVSFDKMKEGHFTNVYLIGPVKQIFHGQIEI